MKVEIIIEVTNTGYSAYSDKFAAYTTGTTLEELKANMLEAMNLYFEKEGKTIHAEDLKFNMDLPQFFDFYKVINTKALSNRIGMKQELLTEYVKGTKKPTPIQTRKILTGVQQLGKQLAALQFIL